MSLNELQIYLETSGVINVIFFPVIWRVKYDVKCDTLFSTCIPSLHVAFVSMLN